MFCLILDYTSVDESWFITTLSRITQMRMCSLLGLVSLCLLKEFSLTTVASGLLTRDLYVDFWYRYRNKTEVNTVRGKNDEHFNCSASFILFLITISVCVLQCDFHSHLLIWAITLLHYDRLCPKSDYHTASSHHLRTCLSATMLSLTLLFTSGQNGAIRPFLFLNCDNVNAVNTKKPRFSILWQDSMLLLFRVFVSNQK